MFGVEISETHNMSRLLLPVLCAGFFVAGCSPTVKIEAPDKPITINLNVKIDQEIRVKLDKDVEELIADNPDLF